MEVIVEYIIDNLLAIVAIVISIIALYQNNHSDKSKIKREIAKKKAELKALNSQHHFIDGTTMNDTIIRRSVLQNEIEELENSL